MFLRFKAAFFRFDGLLSRPSKVKHTMSSSSKSDVKSVLLPYPTTADKIAKKAHKTFLIAVTIGLSVFIAWATFVHLDTVTRGSGSVIPSLQNQFVQHLEGGIVTEIDVQEGQYVNKGDVLMRVQDQFAQAELSRAALQLTSREIQLKRLDAESLGKDEITFDKTIEDAFGEQIANERLLFAVRQKEQEEQILILKDQFERKSLELSEKRVRLDNMKVEFGLVKQRVDSLTRLAKSGAVSKNELLKNRTALQQIQTKLSDLEFQIPQAVAELSETARRQTEVKLRFRAQAEEEKREALLQIAQLRKTIAAMSDRNARTEVRAPISGKVHRLFQTTIGGIVRGGDNLVQLIPSDAPIEVEIKLSPKDRANVWVDLPGVVKISAYDFSIHGGLPAKITDISSDVLQDEAGEPYFRVRLEADVTAFGPEKPIIAGMTADVDILTGKRSIMEYLLSPINQVSEKALRET